MIATATDNPAQRRFFPGTLIGEGARGVVYADRKRKIAYKYVKPGDESARLSRGRSIRREGAILASLPPHQRIVRYVDHGEVAGEPYLATGLVEGKRLDEVVLQERFIRGELVHRPLPLVRALQYTDDLAQALAHVHGQGFVHADVKPGNVVVAERATLTDFDVAREEGRLLPEEEGVGRHIGAPAYCSPSRFAGEAPSKKDDLFSLGLLLSFMLSPTCVLSEKEAQAHPQGVEVAALEKHRALAVNVPRLPVHGTVKFLIAGLVLSGGEKYFPDAVSVSRYIHYVLPRVKRNAVFSILGRVWG